MWIKCHIQFYFYSYSPSLNKRGIFLLTICKTASLIKLLQRVLVQLLIWNEYDLHKKLNRPVSSLLAHIFLWWLRTRTRFGLLTTGGVVYFACLIRCYNSQLKYVFRLVENVPHVGGQKSPNSLGQAKLTNPWETTTWTSDSHVIRSCALKLHQICEPAGVKQTIFLQFFSILSWEVNKLNHNVPRVLGKQISPFPLRTVIKWLLSTG